MVVKFKEVQESQCLILFLMILLTCITLLLNGKLKVIF